jgi:hypothetical protein
MQAGKIAAVLSAAALVATPLAAQAAATEFRASAPVEGESEFAGELGAGAIIIALAAIGAGVLLLIDDDDDDDIPVSP